MCVNIQNQYYCAPAFTVTGNTTITITVPAPPVVVSRTLSGTLLDAAGAAVAGARVIAGSSTSSTLFAITDPAGHYSITVPSGSYPLMVIIGQFNGNFAEWAIGPTPAIDLTAGDVVQNLRLPPKVSLTVLVKDSNGNPLGGSIISQGHGNTTLLANDPTPVPTSQLLQGGAGTTFQVVDGLTFGSGVSVNSMCVNIQNQYYCAPAFTVTGNTTVVIQQQPELPAAPANLTGATPTAAAPTLTWNSVSGAASYRIYRDGVEIGVSQTPTFVDTMVTSSGQYSYTVIAATADGLTGPASTPFVVVYDIDKPTVGYSQNPAPNDLGWNNSDVTVTFTCNDAGAGMSSCSGPVTVAAEGADQTATGSGTDNAGNTATVTAQVNVDRTAPTLGVPAWTANPKPAAASTTLTVPVSDNLSGVLDGEYFLDTDPGTGNATAMTVATGTLTATVTAALAVGVHPVGIRARDRAGNWTATTLTYLVVNDPTTTLEVTGKNKKDLIPSLANGDVLPGLTAPGQSDAVDYGFTVGYRNGQLDPRNDLQLTYTTGSHCNGPHATNCHQFSLNATGFEWVLIDQPGNSRGRFQGTATVVVNGVTTINPFVVEAIDGDRLSPAGNDHLIIKVYAPGADPATAQPIYQASGSMAKGNSVRIK
jgi:hypothetical protein